MIAFGRGRGALGFLIVGVALGGLDAHAASASAWIHPEDGEDDHGRPHAYLDPTLAVPPASAEEPDYPLAAAFIPADPSNYTKGGIVSYDYVVVHTMQGYYAGSISWFQNPAANVSAHYVMRAEDGEVTQMVRNDDRAWHVGSSNPYALGIEHEGFVDDPSWYTWNTYVSSARLTRWLCDTYGIPIDRNHVVGHVELPNQTHTDPGPHWAWDMYMALVHDVVPSNHVVGVVVDASRTCSLTATTDTWLKRTLEASDALAEHEKCFVPAGTSIEYAHASADMVGHRRLTLVGDHPCVGLPDVEAEAFAYAGHFDGFCPPEDLAAAGVTVALDAGAPVPVEADGSFAFSGVSAGAHVLDVAGEGFLATAAPVDVEVHPGARVVIRIEPEEIPGGDGTSGGGADDGGVDDSESGDAGAEGEQPGSGGTPEGGSGVDPALPDGFGLGDGDDEGCACTSAPHRRPLLVGVLIPLVLRRRRRA